MCIRRNVTYYQTYFSHLSPDGDVRVVDWQLVRIARPVLDLAYFFGSSLSLDFRREHVDDLLKYYHLALTKCLDKLGHAFDYTFDAFEQEFRACFIYGTDLAMLHSQVQLTDMEAVQKRAMEAMGKKPEGEEEMLKLWATTRKMQREENKANPAMRKRVLQLAREADRYGYFEH